MTLHTFISSKNVTRLVNLLNGHENNTAHKIVFIDCSKTAYKLEINFWKPASENVNVKQHL